MCHIQQLVHMLVLHLLSPPCTVQDRLFHALLTFYNLIIKRVSLITRSFGTGLKTNVYLLNISFQYLLLEVWRPVCSESDLQVI